MKKFLIPLMFSLVPLVSNAGMPGYADSSSTVTYDYTKKAVSKNTDVASTSFVQGAYAELDSKKQEVLTGIETTKPFVTKVVANEGKLEFQSDEISIPTGDANGVADNPQRLPIWFE